MSYSAKHRRNVNYRSHSFGIPVKSGASEATKVQVVTSLDEFDALHDPWNTLLDKGSGSIFQKFEWQRSWWRHFGETNRNTYLHIIVVEISGTTAAIAPLQIEKMRAPGLPSLRVLSFLGGKLTDYLDFIVHPRFEKEAIESIAGHIGEARSLFDVISLTEIPEHSPTSRILFDILQASGLQGTRFINEYCPRVALGPTWEATLGSMDSSRARRISRRIRLISRDHETHFEVLTPSEDITGAMREFIRMHQGRWKKMGELGVFDDERVVKFHLEVAEQLQEWVFLAFLCIDGVRVAADYCFLFRGTLSYYLNGIDCPEDLMKLSPGLVVHSSCMQEAIRRGAHSFDFLRGIEQYKYDLGAADIPNWSVLLYSGSASRIRLLHRVYLVLDSVKKRGKKEIALFRHEIRKDGLLASSTLRFLASRLRTVLVDSHTKISQPEKPIYMSQRSQTDH